MTARVRLDYLLGVSCRQLRLGAMGTTYHRIR
jgi:hypothetical protein